MKAVFFFDTVLLENDGNYFAMTLTYDFLKNRYLQLFDQLTVSTRKENMSKYKGDKSGYKKTNGKGILVKPVSHYKGMQDIIKYKKKINEEIKQIIKDNDVVIIRMPSVIGVIACGICRKLKKKYIIEMVACPWDGYKNHYNKAGKIIALLMYYLTRRRVKNAELVFYVTDHFLQNRYPTKGKAVNCSDVVLNNDNTLRKRTRFHKTHLIMGTVANIGLKYKGHKYAIKALKILERKGLDVEYVLIGNGNKERIMRLAEKYHVSNRIRYLGSLSHDEVFNELNKIDIYIQPSLQEGLPRSMIEAMDAGCICVGSKVGGIPELIGEEFQFKKRSANAIAKVIMNISRQDFEKISIYNKKAAERFQPEKLDRIRNAAIMNYIHAEKSNE